MEIFGLKFSSAQTGADAVKFIKIRLRKGIPMFDVIYMDF